MRIIKFYILISIAFIFCCYGCGVKPDTPIGAFRIIKKAALNHNWNTYWEMLSEKSQASFNDRVKYMSENFKNLSEPAQKRMLESLGISKDDLYKLDGKSFFIQAMNNRKNEKITTTKDSLYLFTTCKVVYVETKENNAILYIEDELKNQEKIPLVNEKGVWKLDLAAFLE